MNTIFYSWQSDRPTGNCRNIIERSLQSAMDRLHADVQIEESLRESLKLDKDTKDVPGTPAIFDTIMRKIAGATVFVADLTFVGERQDGRPTSNPNVLIEYGYALAKPGGGRIIAVMNDVYGKPSNTNLPFNVVHTRFPIAFTLNEDAGAEERQTARNVLTKSFEGALRTIFESTDYKADAEAARRPSALDVASLHREELEFESAIASLQYGSGPAQVQKNAEELFVAIKSRCDQVNATHDLGIECGFALGSYGQPESSCVLKTAGLGTTVSWRQPILNSLEDARLSVRSYAGRLYLPGTYPGGVQTQAPRLIGEEHYEHTLSRDRELGWVKKMKSRQDSSFVNNEDLADYCVSRLLNILRQEHKSR